MEKEFNLSLQKDNMGDYSDSNLDFYHSADVKEFIRQTLEIIDTRLTNRKKIDRINKLAGGDLI